MRENERRRGRGRTRERYVHARERASEGGRVSVRGRERG